MRVWNLQKLQEAVFQGHTKDVNSVVITHDSKYIVSSGYDKTVRIWNLQKKCQKAILQGHTNEVWSLAITHDRKFIISGSGSNSEHYKIVSSDNTARIWNFKKKVKEYVLKCHIHCVNAIVVTNDSKYIVLVGKIKL